MKFRILGLLVVLAACLVATPAVAQGAPGSKTLKPFLSDADLKRYLQHIAMVRKQAERARRAKMAKSNAQPMAAMVPMPAPPAPSNIIAQDIGKFPDANASEALQRVPGESITNNQVANVDEGDIVKSSGDLLIVLHHGRLFTVSLKGGGMKPVDSIDAYAPGINPRGDWYDEMLIAGDRIVIIGYSYPRGGTQINRFRVSKDGHLRYEDAYALRSNDYYSARNYASRLIGNTLIFYSPNYIPWYGKFDIPLILPGLRRWTGDVHQRFEPIGSARNVYIAPGLTAEDVSTLHTVTACDLTAAVLACKATSILGADGRVFYVSNSDVYVWVTSWHWSGDKKTMAMLYRLPLDGSAPQALRTAGAPVDQFSFNETPRGLDVLVRADSKGDAMWASARSDGAIALAHVPFEAFGDGSDRLAKRNYRALPNPKGAFYDFHNRFVGDYVLYGTGNGWGAPKDATGTLYTVPVRGGEVTALTLPNGIDRIEAMGGDAVVVGSSGKNIVFSTIALKPGKPPALGDQYTLGGASQAETRSHGFFFKPERDYSGDYGVLGLPVMRDADPAYRQLFREAASVVFVRRTDGRFHLLGDLPSHPQDARADNCKASCVDWYGNSRPIFYGDRTFALMGYELVEGTLGERDIAEKARVNFNPGVPQPVR